MRRCRADGGRRQGGFRAITDGEDIGKREAGLRADYIPLRLDLDGDKHAHLIWGTRSAMTYARQIHSLQLRPAHSSWQSICTEAYVDSRTLRHDHHTYTVSIAIVQRRITTLRMQANLPSKNSA